MTERRPTRTRQAIIDALLAACKDGEYFPTAKELAERAGISQRSVFVHFADLGELRVAATSQQCDRIENLVVGADPGLPAAERVDAVVRQTEKVFALQRRVRLLGLIEASGSSVLDDRMRRADRKMREALSRTFSKELASSGSKPDEQLLDMVESVAGWSFRHHLVDRRRLSQRAASQAVRRSLGTLLNI
ncbi:MAG: TetR/AcrR family transcriptional regulator [Mycobacteriaceae bacterium]|nr:TetR/AcrR family transcriptional regulator [Mycobacteriaceae bacterium]